MKNLKKMNWRKWLAWLAAAHLVMALPLMAQQPDNSNSNDPAKAQQAEVPDSSAATNAVANSTNAISGESDKTEESEEHYSGPLISIGRDVELKAGQTAEAVVVIWGNAKINGKVRQAVVAIGGDLDIYSQVGDAAVAVFGNIKAHPGSKVRGDAVAVGGNVDVSEGAHVRGVVQPVQIPKMHWLGKYFTHCVLLMRPLAPEVGWIWIVAGVWFLLYILVAALFPAPIEACVNELRRRPASTFLMGIVAKILLPLAFLILAMTGVGLVVIPFVIAAVVLGAIIGRIALTEWIGFKLGASFKRTLDKPIIALLLGGLVIAILYMVPVVGFLTLMIVSVWGLGCAVTAAYGGLRRESPPRTIPAPAFSPAPAMAMQAAGPISSAPTAPLASSFSPAATSPGPMPDASATATAAPNPAASISPPIMPDVFSFPRASFWERMGAGFLDFVLIGIVSSFFGHLPVTMILTLAYFAAMWTWKGTSIGGIVLGLKVVRLDSQPVTFPVALVRALAGGFSIVVLFLGILWIAWDLEKQGWHDRIAGTVVLRLPRGTPLLCI